MKRGLRAVTVITLVLAPVATRAEVVPLDSERWRYSGAEHRIETHLGRQSLYLKGATAWIDGEAFLDGVLEFDIAFSEQRGFSGGAWRMIDDGIMSSASRAAVGPHLATVTRARTFDSGSQVRGAQGGYMRPHQAGNPDANQYTPLFHGLAAWQLYHGDGYGAPVAYRFDEWMHVKIVFSGTRGEVFIDSDAPVLTIHELKRPLVAGTVGLTASDFAPAWFSNFSYSKLEAPALSGPARPPRARMPGVVETWRVSNGIPEASVDDKLVLTAEDKQGLEWSDLDADAGGIANLAQARPWTPQANTVFARVTLQAARAETRRVRFGYSDRVRVFLNDRLIYAGNNDYRSRDYRYLGTIGLFDAVYLPLSEGPNELWFAVSESFGGWGIQCVIDPPAGAPAQAGAK